MINKYIMFLENYKYSKTKKRYEYMKGIKYKIEDIKDDYIYFNKDKVLKSLCNVKYVVGDIITSNVYRNEKF